KGQKISRTFADSASLCHNDDMKQQRGKGNGKMKPWVVFVLLACLLTPSSALAEWVITDEKTEVRASFSLDEPSTAKPAPGGGYFLGDGPTILKPEGLPEPTNP